MDGWKDKHHVHKRLSACAPMCAHSCVYIYTYTSYAHLSAAPCAPGTFSETGLAPCEKCPVSTYQPASGKTFCHRCEFDQLTDTEGAASKDACGELIVYSHKYFSPI